ncbi:hypothetical protein [Paenibacillus daejeonensis]|uniref:hypothetical protein n=1 Tax=Paenibacillus daejeonensis TaxID=135193 RepID=UPI00035E28E9|nr:hypothetical protein [Paenibacillus daejeonensis]
MKLRKSILLASFLALSLTGCSQSKVEQIQGSWTLKEVDQMVDADNELVQFNYLEFKEQEVILKQFAPIHGVRPEEREFYGQEVEMGYEIVEDQRMELAFGTYDLDLKKSDLILKNEEFTLHYKKDSSN